MHKLLPILNIFLLNFFGTNYAEAHLIQELNETTLAHLVTLPSDSILSIEDQYIYLNPKNIIINENGIFLSSNEHTLLQLRSLFSNEFGIFTKLEHKNISIGTVWPIIQCKWCGSWFAKTIFNRGECPTCHGIN